MLYVYGQWNVLDGGIEVSQTRAGKGRRSGHGHTDTDTDADEMWRSRAGINAKISRVRAVGQLFLGKSEAGGGRREEGGGKKERK